VGVAAAARTDRVADALAALYDATPRAGGR